MTMPDDVRRVVLTRLQHEAVTLDSILAEMENEDPRETLKAWQRVAGESLRKIWDTPEEDAAWAHLQKGT
jgi:hypothetical protein